MAVQFQAKELLHILSSCLQKQHVHFKKKTLKDLAKTALHKGQSTLPLILDDIGNFVTTDFHSCRETTVVILHMSVCHEKDLLSIAEFNSVTGWVFVMREHTFLLLPF